MLQCINATAVITTLVAYGVRNCSVVCASVYFYASCNVSLALTWTYLAVAVVKRPWQCMS